MRIDTHRFGTITLDQDQLFLFPGGLVGMETLRDWALLPDQDNPAVVWLQSASRADRALPVISPRTFFHDYRIQVSRRDLTSLHLKPGAEVYVLTTVSGYAEKMTTNLRSPIVLNLSRRLGCQLITNNDHPIQRALPNRSLAANTTEAEPSSHIVLSAGSVTAANSSGLVQRMQRVA